VKFLFEGEEEIGSPHLPAFVREHAGELAADLVISADGAMWRPGELPATALFERVLGAKTLFFSFSTADEKLHAPNEYLRIRRLREGMRAWEQLWRLLAAGPRRLAAVGRPRPES
jgi:acetylornithine deacetylase/succinyl-diaminopimelate desuccinylase-like protein